MSESSHRSNGALSAAERDALQVMFDRLSGSYYEVLGVARDCDRAALRGAFFDQLERFSSERFEGRDLGGYALHIEAIAREINMAFAVLGEPDRRAQYDRRLALSSDLRGVDEVVRDTRTPMPMIQRTNPKTPPPMYGRDVRTSPVQGRDVPNPPPAIARAVRTPQPPPARSSSHPSPASGNGALPSGMALESLGRLRAENRSREAQRSLEDLEALIEKAARNDDHGEIVRLLRHAVTLRPDEASWRSRLARAEETLQDFEVQRLANAARNAEKVQRWDSAGELWAKIADLRPADAQAALHAAQALCEAAQDFARAAEYAKRASRLAPDMIAAHICLTRVFFKAGRTASARSALEQAAKLDPRHADVVALGQKLRG